MIKCHRNHNTERRAAAKVFVDTYVQDGQTLGLGTGELSSLCIAEIGQRIMSGKLSSIRGVPTCNAAASEAAFHGLPLATDSTATQIDLAFDQVDALDIINNACIFGGEFILPLPHALLRSTFSCYSVLTPDVYCYCKLLDIILLFYHNPIVLSTCCLHNHALLTWDTVALC
jgi:hypothetical protein